MVIIGRKEDNGQSHSDSCYSVQARMDGDGLTAIRAALFTVNN
jgi:hypothetical protein